LLHISQISHERIASVTDVLKVGDEVEVKVLGVEPDGKIALSRKVLLGPPPARLPRPASPSRFSPPPRPTGRPPRPRDRGHGPSSSSS
jgi:polyribonucleotide nucleotidyltransferase